MYELKFDEKQYEIRNLSLNDIPFEVRCYEDIVYCMNPVSDLQRMHIYVPECYYHDGTINGYGLHTAPVFMPNTVGGYREGPAMKAGTDVHTGKANTALQALMHGYVVVCAGIRGNNTVDEAQHHTGRAPALIVDMKAAIRYLRHNRNLIPGNVEQIITSGTSAGGALSALTGASGNSMDYEPYLNAIGAADERDDIFGANCYCPIHNLEHADTAYEWMFEKEHEYHVPKWDRSFDPPKITIISGMLNAAQLAISRQLKQQFPSYVNSLHLKDENGTELTLDEKGEGTFRDYIISCLLSSATKEKQTHDSCDRLKDLAVAGSAIDEQDYITFDGNTAVSLDWNRFITKITRMKAVPAFDHPDCVSPENREFGDETVYSRHFTDHGMCYDTVNAQRADEKVVKLLNPTQYIGTCDTAKHWRIRHGSFDRDTALAIPVILSILLKNRGYDVDFALPWGIPHSGDYDLNELFAWIDQICRKNGSLR